MVNVCIFSGKQEEATEGVKKIEKALCFSFFSMLRQPGKTGQCRYRRRDGRWDNVMCSEIPVKSCLHPAKGGEEKGGSKWQKLRVIVGCFNVGKLGKWDTTGFKISSIYLLILSYLMFAGEDLPIKCFKASCPQGFLLISCFLWQLHSFQAIIDPVLLLFMKTHHFLCASLSFPGKSCPKSHFHIGVTYIKATNIYTECSI